MRALLLHSIFLASFLNAQPPPDPIVLAAQEREAKTQQLMVAFTTDETHNGPSAKPCASNSLASTTPASRLAAEPERASVVSPTIS